MSIKATLTSSEGCTDTPPIETQFVAPNFAVPNIRLNNRKNKGYWTFVSINMIIIV